MSSSKRRLPLLAVLFGLVPLAGCQCRDGSAVSVDNSRIYPHQVESFQVKIDSIQIFGTSASSTDSPQYLMENDSWSYTWDRRLPMPKIGALLQVEVTALDENGNPTTGTDLVYDLPVSFRITPGNIVAAGDTTYHDSFVTALQNADLTNLSASNSQYLPMADGYGQGYVVVDKVFGETRLWAQDSPPDPTFRLPCTLDDNGNCIAGDDAGTPDVGYVRPDAAAPGPDASQLGFQEPDGGRTYSGGLSEAFVFASPLIADLQKLPGKTLIFDSPSSCPSSPEWDDTISPFIGNFLTVVGAPPTADMVVTAITSGGFYVTDKLAAPVTDFFYTEDPTGNRTLPGTFGSIYVYTYNYPDGLYVCDRVLGITGTVQEFSGDTQLTFPSWVRKDENEPTCTPPGQPDPRPAPILIDFSNSGETCDVGAGLMCSNNKAPLNSLRCVVANGTSPCNPGQTASCGPCQREPVDTCAPFGQECNPNLGSCQGGCPATPCAAGQWCVQHRCVDSANPCGGNYTCQKGERCNPATGACECGPSLGFRLSKTPVWSSPSSPNEYTMFAYSVNNIEIESLESSIVKISNVRPSNTFVDCDANGNGYVPNFAWIVPNYTDPSQGTPGCPNWNATGWGCYDSGEDTPDCACNINCTGNDSATSICTELTGFQNYGQFAVQTEDTFHTRMNVDVTSVSGFDPLLFQKPQFAHCRVDVSGVLRQVEAARPRWMVVARDESDFCCRPDPAFADADCPTRLADGSMRTDCPTCICPRCPAAEH